MIVQNFRAKPDTAMRHADDLGLEEYRATIAVARLVLGPKVRVQAPPNLVDLATECRALLEAGVDDWGGVSPLTPDHVNPERPWPSLERLRAVTAECGFELRERLTVHPEYVVARRAVARPADLRPRRRAGPAEGRARPRAPRRTTRGLPWQEPDGGFAVACGRTDLHAAIDTDGRTEDRRSDFDEVYGDWDALREAIVRDETQPSAPRHGADRRGLSALAAGGGGPGRAHRRAGAGR